MPAIKTQKSKASVSAFLNDIDDDNQRKDAKAVHKMMREATGARASMWGPSIVGYGKRSYTTADGKENAWFQVGFSPRKQSLTLYIMDGFSDYEKLLKRLGKHKTGKSCLYIKRLSDIDTGVLEQLIDKSVAANAKR